MQIVFDYDGVIADSMMYMVRVLNDIAAELKVAKIDDDGIRYWRENGPVAALKKSGISVTKIPYIAKRTVEIQRQNSGEIKFFDGINKVIKKIKQEGISIGILTSNDLDNVRLNLIKNDLNVFDFIESGVKFLGKSVKLSKLKKKVGEFVYVGDELRDIEACKKANIPIIAVSWGFNDKKLLKDADYVVDTPMEFLNLVLRLNQ
jgi:phosphoglycolate phosphatase